MILNYKTLGTGPPVIILHGLFGMLDNWMSFAKKMADHFTVYIVDQRNHGKSFKSDSINYPLLAQDLKHLVDHLGLTETALIGHSMGGKTVMQFALEQPERVSKMVVVDIAPRVNEARHLELFDAILSLNLNDFTTRKEIDGALAPEIRDSPIRQFLLKNLGRSEDGKFEWKANFKALYANYVHILDTVHDDGKIFSKPSLFVRGTRSEYIAEKDTIVISRLFPASSLKNIEAGHWVHAEKPGELLETITRFLHYSGSEFVT